MQYILVLEIIFPIHTKLFGRKLVHYPAQFPQYKNFSSLIFRSRAKWQDVDFPTQCTFWSYLIISVVTAHQTHNGVKSFSEEAFSITLHGSLKRCRCMKTVIPFNVTIRANLSISNDVKNQNICIFSAWIYGQVHYDDFFIIL